MTTATISLSHPILFVFDFANRSFDVPEFDEAKTVSANSDGLSIKAVSDVDGDVTVHLTVGVPSSEKAAAREVHCGSIATPSGRVSVVTSHNEQVLEADVGSKAIRIRVLADDLELPTEIWIEVCPE